MTVRPYRSTDADALSDIYRRAVGEIGGHFYSEEQTAAWLSLAPSATKIDELGADGRLRLVAADKKDIPVAFIDVGADGHIHFLYCSPDAAGRGVASALYNAAEARSAADGLTRLFAEASEAARPFFEKHGFRVSSRRAFAIGDVDIHNYAVEKILPERGRG